MSGFYARYLVWFGVRRMRGGKPNTLAVESPRPVCFYVGFVDWRTRWRIWGVTYLALTAISLTEKLAGLGQLVQWGVAVEKLPFRPNQSNLGG